MPSVVDFLAICLDGRGVIDETWAISAGVWPWMLRYVRRRSCSVQPDSLSESSFLYLLHPEKGRSAAAQEGKTRSVSFRRRVAFRTAATRVP